MSMIATNNRTPHAGRQSGFTLIELVVVIAIIGILAAVALPRYAAMQVDARVAKANAIYGAIRSASALAHARCLLDLAQGFTGAGQCGNAAPQVNMEGTLINIINQYPTANAAGIISAAQISASDGLTISAGGAGAATEITIDVVGAATPATCRVSYTSGASAAVNSPVITVTTTTC